MPNKGRRGTLRAALTPESQRLLLAKFPPRFKERFHLHITLRYAMVARRFYPKVSHTVQVIGITWNHSIQAALVSLEGSKLQSEMPVPHITISAKSGIPPVDSNTMLASEHDQKLCPSFSIEVVQEFIPSDRRR